MMKTVLRAFCALAALGALALPATALGRTVESRVDGEGGKTCNVYLHVADDAPHGPVPLVLSQQGTGIYTTARVSDVEPALRTLLRAGRIAVLTIDKPGIVPDGHGKPTVIDEIYNRYTQTDLVRCLVGAIDWSAKASPVPLQDAIYLSGHSEGAQVMARLYESLARSQPRRGSVVRALLLSGLPMDDWRQMLDGQLSAGQRQSFWGGYEKRDDAVLRRFGGLTFFYLHSAFAQEPLRKTLSGLATLASAARFRIFQGLRDRNTRADLVMAFERENDRRRVAGQPALDLKVRYYDAGHGLNQQAVDDIAADLGESLGVGGGAGSVTALQ